MKKQNQRLHQKGVIKLEEAAECVSRLKALWAASLEAEQAGDISQALLLHEQVLADTKDSYVADLRAGWLHYQAGGFARSLRFYENALRLSPGSVIPLFGAMGCYVAMGNSRGASSVVQAMVEGTAGSPRPDARPPCDRLALPPDVEWLRSAV